MNPIIIGSILFFNLSSFAENSAPTIECKELDFNSYHKVQNVKANIIKTTPDRSHPNFAGKYLLLKNEFLFDTGWFVADCSTGKFIKEMLSTSHKHPKAEFNVNSTTVLISDQKENQIAPEYHLFQNEKWMRVEPSPSPVSTPLSAPTASPVATEALFTHYPANLILDTCKEPDYASYSRAESAKKSLLENTPDRTHPNFGGHFLLLKGETIFQTYWLIADCQTGKFFHEILTGGAYFEKNSRLLKIYSSGNFPSYYVWLDEEQQWIKQTGSSNSITGQNAQTLWNAIASANTEKLSSIRFENLKCVSDRCEFDMGKEKIKQVLPAKVPALISFLKSWNHELKIKAGKCKNENKTLTCEFEN